MHVDDDAGDVDDAMEAIDVDAGAKAEAPPPRRPTIAEDVKRRPAQRLILLLGDVTIYLYDGYRTQLFGE